MVVGGYSADRGPMNDVEVLSLSPQDLSKTLSYKNRCAKSVRPIADNYYVVHENDTYIAYDDEAEVLGGVGLYTQDSPTFCGGENRDGDQAKCYQWEYQTNRYITAKT